ncbi:MFS transporter [Halapricum desulfuricans]|uniref:MFS family permease n=1 Tax=Halapricum desulfuricans TaxID=2841257 RepID=A0A897N5K5_9EURY|nr:MFS transporter [Halapricum desulfuricans]QSG06513.1 MFS family permease [Halapricum desulfuricans]
MRPLLGNRNFRRLFAGRLVTNVGDSLYFVAATWLVYDLTGDPFFSGLAGFLVMAPQGLQAFAGPLVDRWDLRRVLVTTQIVQAIVILTLPVAAHLGWLSVWVVLTVMPLLSLLNQFVYPAQSAALPRIVEREELVEANSLFSLAYQGTELVANAAAGILVAAVGAVALFAIDSITFAAAALLFATVHVPPAGAGDSDASASADTAAETATALADGGAESTAGSPSDGSDTYRESLLEGVGFVRGTVLAPIVLGAAVVNFVASGATIGVLPAFADTLGGSGAYGALMAAIAGGMLAGAVVASGLDELPFGWLSIGAFLASGCLWIAAIVVDWLPATVALLAIAVVPIGASNVLLSSIVQSAVPDRLLGRVSGLLGSASTAAVPAGALLGGLAASIVGPAVVMMAGGANVLLLAGYWLAHPRLRRMGPADGVETIAT